MKPSGRVLLGVSHLAQSSREKNFPLTLQKWPGAMKSLRKTGSAHHVLEDDEWRLREWHFNQWRTILALGFAHFVSTYGPLHVPPHLASLPRLRYNLCSQAELSESPALLVCMYVGYTDLHNSQVKGLVVEHAANFGGSSPQHAQHPRQDTTCHDITVTRACRNRSPRGGLTDLGAPESSAGGIPGARTSRAEGLIAHTETGKKGWPWALR